MVGPSQVDIHAVARLAGLTLSAEEAPRFARELERVLEWVAAMDAVPTEGVEPMRYPAPTACALRADEPDAPLAAEAALALAPETAGGFFAVPRVA